MTTFKPDALDAPTLPRGAAVAMAVCAVLAPALTGVGYALNTETLQLDNEELVGWLADDVDALTLPGYLAVLAAVLWAPAVMTAGRVARAGAPALGLVAFVLAFGMVLPTGPDPYELAQLGLESGLDVRTTTELIEAADGVPGSILAWMPLVGLLGLVLLGVALLRGDGPRWAGFSLIVGPIMVPATWIAGSALLGVAAWAVLTAGFAGCAMVLVRNVQEERQTGS